MVTVESIDDSTGGLVSVTLSNGVQEVTCDGMEYWDDLEGDELEQLFAEWAEYANAGEEGYTIETIN